MSTVEPPRDDDKPHACPICLMPLMPNGECVRHDRDEMMVWAYYFRSKCDELEAWLAKVNADLSEEKIAATCEDTAAQERIGRVEKQRDDLAARVAELEASLGAQLKSNERARARYAAAHPAMMGCWPDRTDMVEWMMERTDALADALRDARRVLALGFNERASAVFKRIDALLGEKGGMG